GRYTTPATSIWANATHVCTCEVDIATGVVTLLRYIVSEDCGPMINPNIVEGQIDGGTVQGIGGALYEHLAYDADGNPVTTTFMDYLMPTMAEMFMHLATPTHPLLVHLEVRVDGSLDEERLRAAVLAAIGKHPLARARLQPWSADDKTYVWHVEDQVQLDPVRAMPAPEHK